MAESYFETYKLFGPRYCALPSMEAAAVIVDKAKARQSFGVAALAVHGLVESINQPALGKKINKIEMIVPDGQPIVWALNSFYKLNIKFKVPGPSLTLDVLRLAEEKSLSIYLYGSTADTLAKFTRYIELEHPNLNVVGVHEDRFRDATEEEDLQDIAKINNSGAHIVLVGRGCPRQEHWVADHVGKINASMLAVGAAFDYHAGKLNRAPFWIQRAGLEWFFRLVQEPQRLWRRYLFTNSQYMRLFLSAKLRNKLPG